MLSESQLKLANCTDPSIDRRVFFPEFHDSKSEVKRKVTEAKEICSSCPIRLECLQSALDDQDNYGVWGGREEEYLQQARFVDVAGRPIKDRASVICPNCLDETRKDLYVVEVFYNHTTDVSCNACGLIWRARKEIDPDDPQW